MKTSVKRLVAISLLILAFTTALVGRQSDRFDYLGAWVSKGDDKGRPVTNVLIVTEKFFTIASFLSADHHFLLTSGGTYKIDGNKMIVTVEYHSSGSHMVGKTHELNAIKSAKGYKLTTKGGRVLGDWEKIDGATSGLAGVWLETSYMNEKGDTLKTVPPVRTIKLLSDSRFQWVTYNTSTHNFIASAGGTYRRSSQGYFENIEFYADADDNIGKSLSFSCELSGKYWQLVGLNPNGAPLYELWSKR